MRPSLALSSLFLLAGCTFTRPQLEGAHLPPPPTPQTTVEIPSPPINVAGLIHKNLPQASLPKDEKDINLGVARVWYKYWPDFPLIGLKPDLISTHVPYNYAFKAFKIHIRWVWLHIDTWWDLVREECCGKTELGLETSFHWTPEWNLAFASTTKGPGGEIGNYLSKNQLDVAAKSIDENLNKSGQYKPLVTDFWHAITNPIDLGGNSTLLVNPERIWVSPIQVTGDYVSFSLNLSARPQIDFDHAASAPPVSPALPALEQAPASGGDVVIALDGRISFREAARILLERLEHTSLPTRFGKAKIVDAEVYGLNKALVIGVKVKSALFSGWLYLNGDLEYRSINYTFLVRNLHLAVKTSNPITAIAASLFRGQFEETLQQQAYWHSQTATEQLSETIEKRFHDAVKGRLGLQVISIRPVVADNRQVIFTSPDAMNIALVARGKIYFPAQP